MAQIFDPSRTNFRRRFRGVVGTPQDMKTLPGTLLALQITNTDTVAAWVQIFDLRASSVVLGTTIPDLELVIPAGSATPQLLHLVFPDGIPFFNAISVASTTTSNGAVGSGAGAVNVGIQAI